MTVPPRSSAIFWGFLACLVGLTFLRADLRARSAVEVAESEPPMATSTAPDSGAVLVPVVAPSPTPPPRPRPVPGPLVRHVIIDTLDRDGSIYLILKGHGIPELDIARVGNALARVFDAQRASRPGDAFRLELDSLRTVVRFEYTPAREPERPVVIERRDDELVARREELALTRRTAAIEVVIEDNLSNAIHAAGEGDALTDLVVDYVFGSVIDFHKEPRRGDRLGVVFTREYVADRFVRYGRVLMARYEGQVVSQVGILYEDPVGNTDYYDADGNSLDRLFLLKPMEFRRISSRFARRRYHPILKRNMPHLGTDYAAAPGTDVWSTARGRVSVAGWNGGFGKMVEIEHPNGYRTRYAHLSRILVRTGQRVEKRDLVGQVGSTGRATGPHLHYELIQNGRHIDPATVNRGGSGRPLAAGYRAAFASQRQRLLAGLEAASSQPGLVIADATLDTEARER